MKRSFVVPKKILNDAIKTAIEHYLNRTVPGYKRTIHGNYLKNDLNVICETSQAVDENEIAEANEGDNLNFTPNDWVIIVPKMESPEAVDTIKAHGFLWKAVKMFSEKDQFVFNEQTGSSLLKGTSSKKRATVQICIPKSGRGIYKCIYCSPLHEGKLKASQLPKEVVEKVKQIKSLLAL